ARVHVGVAERIADARSLDQEAVASEPVADPDEQHEAGREDDEVQTGGGLHLQAAVPHPHAPGEDVAEQDEQEGPQEEQEREVGESVEGRELEDVEREVVAEERVRGAPRDVTQPRQDGERAPAVERDAGEPPAGEDGHREDPERDVTAGDLLGDLEVAVSAPELDRPDLPGHEPQVERHDRGAQAAHHETDSRRRRQAGPVHTAVADARVPERVGVEPGQRAAYDQQEDERDGGEKEEAAGPAEHVTRRRPAPAATVPWWRGSRRGPRASGPRNAARGPAVCWTP